MTAAAAALARLTSGSVWRIGDMGGTGVPETSQEEIMGALGGLGGHKSSLVRLKWCMSERDLAAVERHALRVVAGWFSGKKIKPGTLRAMCRVAIYEVVMPPICYACKGVAFSDAKACKACDGSGRRRIGDRIRAQIASAHRKMGKDTWRGVAQEYDYERVFRMVSAWESDAMRHVWRQINSHKLVDGEG